MIMGEPFWHDGNIIAVELDNDISPRQFKLTCNLVKNLGEPERERWNITVVSPQRLVIAADLSELEKNRFAGQIADGVLLQDKNGCVLRIQLAAGYIEVTGGAILAVRESG